MIVRMLKPNELYKAQMVQAVAFESSFDLAQAKAKCEDPLKKTPYAGTLPHDDRSRIHWAAMSDNEEDIYGCIGLTAFPMRFDGNAVLMGGVGGVATLPQHRRHGAIRECMKAAFADMYDNGYVVSSLYPFSTAYYRKFGYEIGPETTTWTIDLTALKLPDVGGRIEMIMPGDDLSDVCKIYNDCTANWNTSVIREEYDQEISDANWLNEKRYLYLWRDDAGEPRGFMMFCKKDGVMDCRNLFGQHNNLMFADMKALIALLKFAQAFAADYRAIRFTLPSNIRIQSLTAEQNKVESYCGYNAMHRFVNVQRALELCRCCGEGSLRIGITDPMLPQNEGVWQISYAPGKPNCVERSAFPADVTLPIGTFSQLLLGIRCAEDIPLMPEACVHTPAAPFGDVFYSKTCHMLDLF